MADNLSQTVVGLGYVPVDRGDWEKNYQSNPETRYFNDNIVQYKGSAFITDITAENAEGNAGTEDSPRYYITAKPYEESVEELNPGWKVFASDTEFVIKYFAQFFTEEENPEYCYVLLDSEKKILYGIKWDGEFYFGAGCPPQVKDYVESRISDLSLDEYEDIVAFIGDLKDSPKTLTEIFAGISEEIEKKATKINPELSGKISLDKEVNENEEVSEASIQHVDNPEFIDVKVDKDDKVLEGIKADGTKVIGADLQVGGNASVSGDFNVLGTVSYNGVTYEVANNPEYVYALLDSESKVIIGIKTDGKLYADIASLDETTQGIISQVQQMIDEENQTIDEKLSIINSIFSLQDNPEWIQVTTDSEGKILEGRRADGTKVVFTEIEYPNGIPTQLKQYIDDNMPLGSGVSSIEYDDATGDMYATYDDESGVTDVYMEPNGDIYVESEE